MEQEDVPVKSECCQYCVHGPHIPRNNSGALQMLPASLQARIADTECRKTMNRNTHVFSNCNEQVRACACVTCTCCCSQVVFHISHLLFSFVQFLTRFMMLLAEVSLMPGEQLVTAGDMSRELSFATKGTLVVADTKGTLIELISGEGTSACIVGAVSFLLGTDYLSPPAGDSHAITDTAALALFLTCVLYIMRLSTCSLCFSYESADSE